VKPISSCDLSTFYGQFKLFGVAVALLHGGRVFNEPAWDRIAYNNLQRLVDPEAAQAFKHQVGTARRDRQAGYWWRSGTGGPERVPAFGNAVGQSE